MTTCWLEFVALAAMYDDADDIESFVMRGADVNGYDRGRCTPLMHAGYFHKRECIHKQVVSPYSAIVFGEEMPFHRTDKFLKPSLGGATIDTRISERNFKMRKWVQSLCTPLRPFRRELKKFLQQCFTPCTIDVQPCQNI